MAIKMKPLEWKPVKGNGKDFEIEAYTVMSSRFTIVREWDFGEDAPGLYFFAEFHSLSGDATFIDEFETQEEAEAACNLYNTVMFKNYVLPYLELSKE